MKDALYLIQKITNATKAELYIIALLISGLLLGLVINYFDSERITSEQKEKIIAVFDSIAIASEQKFEKPSPLLGDEKNELVNINRASVLQLRKIQGIGLKTASAIVDYRNSSGTFSKTSEIMNVRGIGKKKFELFKKFIRTK
jgi:competence ComEA-like helix-hairpin-helix protein